MIKFGGDDIEGNKLKKSAVYDENTQTSKFSVGLCWKSELEKFDEDAPVEYKWDCQMQLLEFTDQGGQISLKPKPSSWTLMDK